MQVTYMVTQSELDNLYRYFQQESLNPCVDCPSKPGCCGCPKQNSYYEHLEGFAKHLPDGILDCKPITDYVKTWLEADRIEIKIKSMENDLRAKRSMAKSLRTKLLIT